MRQIAINGNKKITHTINKRKWKKRKRKSVNHGHDLIYFKLLWEPSTNENIKKNHKKNIFLKHKKGQSLQQGTAITRLVISCWNDMMFMMT